MSAVKIISFSVLVQLSWYGVCGTWQEAVKGTGSIVAWSCGWEHSAKTDTCSFWKWTRRQTGNYPFLYCIVPRPQSESSTISSTMSPRTSDMPMVPPTSTAMLQLPYLLTFSLSAQSLQPPSMALCYLALAAAWEGGSGAIPKAVSHYTELSVGEMGWIGMGQLICAILLHPRSGPIWWRCYLQTYHGLHGISDAL